MRVQSSHFDDYRKAAALLTQKDLLYPCFCTRKQVASNAQGRTDPDDAPRYGGTCRNLSAGQIGQRQNEDQPFAIRLKMDRVIEAVGDIGQKYAKLADWGDVVLVRKDTPTSYHLSVVVDDAIQGITHVTRGMDMYAATAIHLVLQALLELPTPNYLHHQLINDNTGRKLAKSYADLSLKAMRDDGLTLAELLEIQAVALDQIRG